MQRVWKYIYLCWAILCVVSGYRNLAPERTTYFYPSWEFIVFNFFFFCVMPLAVTVLKQRFGVEMIFRRPSPDRSPFVWGRDPLQVFRLFVISSVSILVGAGLALPKAGHRGVMMFWTCAAVAAGLFIGERLVYLVYAKRIA
jgi:hypothetical protein